MPSLPIESLEPRRLFAFFDGTSGADSIGISSAGGETRVRVNNDFYTTNDPLVTVHALGGNDTVIISKTAIQFVDIHISLGEGDDRVIVRSDVFADFAFGAFIAGGAGNDTIEIDGDAEKIGPRRFVMSATNSNGDPIPPSVAIHDRFHPIVARFTYDPAVENCLITGTQFSDDLFLIEKRDTLSVVVNGMDGDDNFRIGGDDLDSKGWVSSNVTLSGGNGADDIEVEDKLDADDDGPAPVFTLSNLAVTKSAATINYSDFETQTIETPNGMISGLQSTPVVTFNDVFSGSISSTTITGGFARGCVVNINDQNAGGIVNVYQVSDTHVSKDNKPINYANVTQLNLDTSNIFDVVSIARTPAATTLNVNLNDGNDQLYLADGDVSAHLLGALALNGGAGTDSLTISNGLDASPSVATLRSTSFTDGLSHTYSAFEQLALNAGPAGTSLAVHSTGIPVTINGGAGDDHLVIGNGTYSANILGTVTFSGAGGDDSIIFDDSLPTAAQSYLFANGNAFSKSGAAATITKAVEHKTLEAGAGNDIITVSLGSQELHIHANAGNDTLDIVEMLTGTCTINTGAETSPSGDTLIVRNGGMAILDEPDAIRNVTIHNGGTLRIAAGGVLDKASTALNLLGKIDLAGGAMLLRGNAASQSSIRTWLARGYNAGAWNGGGSLSAINSSLAAASALPDAIGYGLGSGIAPTTIGPFTIAPGDTLLRYTLYGDADLNGVVNFDDYSRIDNGFINNRTGWVNGDFNYDNVINFDDYALIDLAFNSQSRSMSMSVAPLPLGTSATRR